MTRFRFVSLCLLAFLCLSLAAPAAAAGPHVVPSGLTESLADALEILDGLLEWLLGRSESELLPAG